MAITPIKALLVLLGGTAAAVATAYLSGALDPFLSPPPATVVSLPAPAGQQPPAAEAPKTDAPQMEAPKAEAEPSAPPAVAGGKQDRLAPSFDLLRVEPDGSMVIAGRAAPNARVELLVADRVIGEATAGADGDFAIVLDKPLEPGDYQIALRATGADGPVTSPETAIVSVPKTPDGQVLAMVEAPGKPAEVITAPKPEAPAAAAAAQQPAPAGETATAAPPAAEPAPAVTMEKPAEKPADAPAVAAAVPEQKPAAPEAPVAAPMPAVRVEAVEIDGNKIFVAGVAEAGRVVRGYANEILLGDAKAAPDGSFLIEAERELPVGNYMIRADVLDQSGGVVARAVVPFEREPGETIAAVAAPAPAATQPAPAPVSPAPVTAAAAPAPATAGQPAPTPPAAMAEAPAAQPPVAQTQPPAMAEPKPAAPAPAEVASAQKPAEEKPVQEKPAGEKPAAVSPAPAALPPATAAEAPAAPKPAAVSPAPAATPPATAEAPAAPKTDVAAAPPAGQPEATAPKLQSVKSAVIIRRGDSLWRISRRVYGRGVRYSTIYLANQDQISNPNRIWPGQVFTVPDTSRDGAPADMSRIGGQATTLQ